MCWSLEGGWSVGELPHGAAIIRNHSLPHPLILRMSSSPEICSSRLEGVWTRLPTQRELAGGIESLDQLACYLREWASPRPRRWRAGFRIFGNRMAWILKMGLGLFQGNFWDLGDSGQKLDGNPQGNLSANSGRWRQVFDRHSAVKWHSVLTEILFSCWI